MDNDAVVGLFFLGFILAAYFFPTLIASMRGHHNTAAIFVLNAFLGWTFLGWVAALVWASTVVWKPVERKPCVTTMMMTDRTSRTRVDVQHYEPRAKVIDETCLVQIAAKRID